MAQTTITKLPRKLTILGVDYKVIYCKKTEDIDSRGDAWGKINCWDHTIKIYNPQDDSLQSVWRTIFHEILHGIIGEYCITEILKLPEDDHERVVECLAAGLFDTLTRNKLIQIE